ncbi:MAG: nucleotidyl transferase AbiEii/AbiGii toxin family protein [Actinomycetota bacterium]
MSSLSARLIAIDQALVDSDIAHAFGGAIALAYCTQDPRGTHDLDVNVFVAPEVSSNVLDALPSEVTITRSDRAAAMRDGQARVRWADTPIDLFFDTHDFYRAVAEGVRYVPFEGRAIPVLSCVDLIVFKVIYGRPRDWVDIGEMLEAGADGESALARAKELLGSRDPSVKQLARTIAG